MTTDPKAIDVLVAKYRLSIDFVLAGLDELAELDDPTANHTSRLARRALRSANELIDLLHQSVKVLLLRVHGARTPTFVGAIALGMATVAGLYGRQRFDLIDQLAVDVLFARWTADRVLEVILEQSQHELDPSAVRARFVTLLDTVCNAADSDAGKGDA